MTVARWKVVAGGRITRAYPVQRWHTTAKGII
jgi:hypothetical protein